MSWESMLKLWLRFSGAVMGLAFLAVLLPTSWMAASNDTLGLDPLPRGPLVEYLTRSLSLLYFVHGSVYWVLAMDPRRLAPVVSYMGWSAVGFGVVVGVIDAMVGMPWAWTLGEVAMTVGGGGVLLFLQSRAAAVAREAEDS